MLGIQIHRNRSRCNLELSQKGYIKKILKRYDISNYKSGNTHVAKENKLSLDQCSKNALKKKENVKDSLCISIRSLVYVQICKHWILCTLMKYWVNI